MSVTTVPVDGLAPYDVHIGRGLIEEIDQYVSSGAQRVMVVYPPSLQEIATTMERIIGTNRTVLLHPVPDAESAKTIEVAAGCWDALGEAGFTRSDVIIAVGGGATTDLAGFVAATWLRGVTVIQVPTTVLAMVDAAVGGKTGINTRAGKNLVGAFHTPAVVLADTACLDSLPAVEFATGLAEVVKAGFISDPVILDLIETHCEELRQWGERPRTPELAGVVAELIHRSITVKADVVSVDLKEAGLREFLNYGHTFGHAVELFEDYRWRHGAAVSVGMVFAAELSRLAGLLSDDGVQRHRDILRSLGLPVTYPAGRWQELLSAMRRDKKTRGDVLRFVVLQDIAQPTRLIGPDLELVTEAYARICVGISEYR